MKLTRQQAINAKCRDCICDDKDTGTWRSQVSACNSKDCALWDYRPLDKANSELKRIENMAKMTPKQLEAYKRKGENFRSGKTHQTGGL